MVTFVSSVQTLFTITNIDVKLSDLVCKGYNSINEQQPPETVIDVDTCGLSIIMQKSSNQ